MSAVDDSDVIESWIEVTPQILGYAASDNFLYGSNSAGNWTLSEVVGFHTNVEEQQLSRLLTDAQDHSDRMSEVAPRSPPPSREAITPCEQIGHNRTQPPLPPVALLYAAAVKASSLDRSLPPGIGEWASRPEVGGFIPLVENPDSLDTVSEWSDVKRADRTWSIRNTTLMKSRLLCWLLDRIPDILSHAATFLLGAATVFFLLRKRINWSRLVVHLPLD